MTILEQIEAACDKANGVRFMRTLDALEVLQMVKKALVEGKARIGGGQVRPNYGFNAIQTVAAATISEEQVHLHIGINNASVGSANFPNPKFAKKNTTLVFPLQQVRMEIKNNEATLLATFGQ